MTGEGNLNSQLPRDRQREAVVVTLPTVTELSNQDTAAPSAPPPTRERAVRERGHSKYNRPYRPIVFERVDETEPASPNRRPPPRQQPNNTISDLPTYDEALRVSTINRQ